MTVADIDYTDIHYTDNITDSDIEWIGKILRKLSLSDTHKNINIYTQFHRQGLNLIPGKSIGQSYLNCKKT